MEHDYYKDYVDAEKEVAYLVEHSDATPDEARALVEGEIRYVEASSYEEDFGEYIIEAGGLNLVKFVDGAVWAFEIEAAGVSTYDGKPIFESSFVVKFIDEQPDIELAPKRAFELIRVQFPNLWDVEEEKDRIRQRIANGEDGRVVSFGRETLEEGDEPYTLWWDVLDRRGDLALLVSHYVIDCRPYNASLPEGGDFPFDDDFFEEENFDQEVFDTWACKSTQTVTWESCDLRAWLNGEFLDRAFNEWEQDLIVESTVENKWEMYGVSHDWGSTADRVFCLSYEDMRQYFGRASTSRCKPTERALNKGVEWVDDDEFAHEPEVVLDNRSESASWWLRTRPYPSRGEAAFVHAEGGADIKGAAVNSRNIGVRPAMWIRVS